MILMYKYLRYNNVNSVILTQFSCDLIYVFILVQSFLLFVGKIALMANVLICKNWMPTLNKVSCISYSYMNSSLKFCLVTLCSHTVARGGSGGMLPLENFWQKWCDLVQSGASQSMLLPTKNQQFCRVKNQQENLIAIFLSPINLDEHVSTKENTFRIYKGVWGASLPEAEEI